MTVLRRDECPEHLFSIAELDFSGDLFHDPAQDPWMRVGAWTHGQGTQASGVEDVVARQSIMIAPCSFAKLFDSLNSIGNALHGMGTPTVWTHYKDKKPKSVYVPFDEFDLGLGVVGAPLSYFSPADTGPHVLLNPDFVLYFHLEATRPDGSVWWDPRRSVDVVVRRVVDGTEVMEVRTDYLSRYLQVRQLALLVGHYRHLHLHSPSAEAKSAYVKGDLFLGSAASRTKAVFDNWGLRDHIPLCGPFLQRRLHLWTVIDPLPAAPDDEWEQPPPFDLASFTFPTCAGQVAPGRWKHCNATRSLKFDGVSCDFMDRVYFRQEVLQKYEGKMNFSVADNGSVSCRDYWGLYRSTSRLGNELVSTAIGDFAEGVPYEEWPHWKQFVVPPPSQQSAESLQVETPIPDAVNELLRALDDLCKEAHEFAHSVGHPPAAPIWSGSADSLAVNQLKWVFPTGASDAEFLKRATLLSTLVIDGLDPAALRQILRQTCSGLDRAKPTADNKEKSDSLGSRKLMERLAFVAKIVVQVDPARVTLPTYVLAVDGKPRAGIDAELATEVHRLHEEVRRLTAPLAFLYDLRISGGVAHPPNPVQAGKAAVSLGLGTGGWTRQTYLALLKMVTTAIDGVVDLLHDAARAS